MTTATAEAPANELLQNDYNEHGVFTTAEIIEITLPKGMSCLISVAHRDFGWFTGFKFVAKARGESSPCMFTPARAELTRRAALMVGLVAASKFFAKEKKAIKLLEEFHESLGAPTLVEKCQLGTGEMAPEAAESPAEPLPKGRFAEVPVAAITPNPENHRKFHDATKAKELADSIRQAGLLQPIAVRLLSAAELGEMPMGGEGVGAQRYEIILGERRWRAHVTIGAELIEAKIYEGVSRSDAKAAALIENLQRQDVNQIEEAEGYRDLMLTKNLTQAQCAARVGRSRAVVANALRVLDLPVEVLDLIREGKLTLAHGLALHKWKDRPALLKVMAEQAVLHATSAGQLEAWNKEDAIPFRQELVRAGLIAQLAQHELPGGYGTTWPEEWVSDPDYLAGGYYYVCFEPAKLREYMEAWQARIDEAAEAAEEKAAAARKKTGIKSLADLTRGQYVELDPAQAEIADLLPESKVLPLKESPEKDAVIVTVCTAPKFSANVISALAAAKRADREVKLPVALAAARAKVKKWKKLGPAEQAIVMAALLLSDSNSALLSPSSAKYQGVTIPAALKLDDYGYVDTRLPKDIGKALKALAADPVGYARVLVDDYLVYLFIGHEWGRMEEPKEWIFHAAGSQDYAMLSAILGEPLGLLEDTAAGRRKLAAQVRALPWYAAAFEQASKAGEDMGDFEEPAESADATGGEDEE